MVSFKAKDEILSRVLTRIAEEGVNLGFISQERETEDSNWVKLIGYFRPVSEDIIRQNEVGAKMIAIIAIDNGLCSEKKLVVKVDTPNLPGQLALIYSYLYCRVNVISMNFDNDTDIIFEVSNVEAAIRILQNINSIKPCLDLCGP